MYLKGLKKVLIFVQVFYRFSWPRFEDCLHVEGVRLSLFYAETIVA